MMFDARKYSIAAALARASGDKKVGGYEKEMSDEICRKADYKMVHGGMSVLVPWQAMLPSLKRDLTAASAVGGGFLVQTDNPAGRYLDALRPYSIVAGLGATQLGGLVGAQVVAR